MDRPAYGAFALVIDPGLQEQQRQQSVRTARNTAGDQLTCGMNLIKEMTSFR